MTNPGYHISGHFVGSSSQELRSSSQIRTSETVEHQQRERGAGARDVTDTGAKTEDVSLFGQIYEGNGIRDFGHRIENREYAKKKLQFQMFVMEGCNNGRLTDTSTKGIRALAERARMQSVGDISDSITNGGPAQSGRHVGVYAGQSRLHAGGALENVLTNILKKTGS